MPQGKLDYLEQQLEIGKLLSKEVEAQDRIDDFSERAQAVGDQIKVDYGKDVSVTVFETDAKNCYIFGNNWAGGTELLYQAMNLTMPKKVEEDALADGYYTIPQEVLPAT